MKNPAFIEFFSLLQRARCCFCFGDDTGEYFISSPHSYFMVFQSSSCFSLLHLLSLMATLKMCHLYMYLPNPNPLFLPLTYSSFFLSINMPYSHFSARVVFTLLIVIPVLERRWWESIGQQTEMMSLLLGGYYGVVLVGRVSRIDSHWPLLEDTKTKT